MSIHTAEWFFEQYHQVFGGLIYEGEYSSRILEHRNPTPSFEDAIIYRLYSEEIFQVLTPWQRIVVKLRIEGHDNDSIAEMYKCGVQNIRNTLGKARKRLRATSLIGDHNG